MCALVLADPALELEQLAGLMHCLGKSIQGGEFDSPESDLQI